jgi:hypothetical protein
MTVTLDQIVLAKGGHDGLNLDPGDPGNCTACFFEWYNALRALPTDPGPALTDDCPRDVSRVLHTFGMRLNDALPDERRQELKRFLPDAGGTSPLSGTHDDGFDEARSYLALDWLIRTYTPAWLDLAGLTVEAQQLRDLRRIVDLVAAQQAGPVVLSVQEKAHAAWDAAGDAAGNAAWAAAGNAAWAAAWDAAWDAAGNAAWAAAWAAAGNAAWAAAWAAAGDKLQPTVDLLQTSAIALFEQMIQPDQPAA